MKPRSQRAHDAVLDAAITLFADRGIEGTSVDAIAAHSGVSKATIYKHWPDKKALCLETLGRLHGLHLPRPSFNSGDIRQDLIDFLSYRPPAEYNEQRERTMPSVIAYAARDPEFGLAWRKHIMGKAVEQAREIMQRGITCGTLTPAMDLDLGVSLLLGPLMYNKIFRGANCEIDGQLTGIADAFLRAFAKY
ncbi:MAG TPA: TetR/AcrR family transcriptional regulator [Bryobacteraceae bacterium]|nr:TetR/AcrR family transcriptional regulator [Bryobacteraceae bacterium]